MTLTQKALRDAAPIEQYPYEVLRKYGEPKTYSSIGDVRRALLDDVDGLSEFAKRAGTDADRLAVSLLGEKVNGLIADEQLPFEVAVVVDEYTGTRYVVSVSDRRKSNG